MNRRKVVFQLLTMVIVLLLLSAQPRAEEIRFSWALLQDFPEGPVALDFNSIPVLKEGDMLQFYLHRKKKIYFYIFLLDSSNNFLIIFPDMKNYYDRSPFKKELMVPHGGDRFTIYPPNGRETFYLLASAKRLYDVEKAMEKLQKYPYDIDRQAVLRHTVRSVQRKNSKMTQITERGVPVSGTRRNIAPTRSNADVAPFFVTEVVAEGFYSKILRLHHE